MQSDPDTVTLIDWETGGLGLPVLDLGTCLIESLLDAQPSGSRPAASRPAACGSGPAASRPAACGSEPAAWLVEPAAWLVEPAAWLVKPDEDRIAAVARGCASQRVLGPAERALLPAAVRFGACYVGANHLHQALAEGVRGASMEARLRRLRNWVSVSEAVARLATPYLADGTEVADSTDLAGGAETVR